MAKKKPTADELRAAADRLEEQALVAPAAAPPLAIGDAQNFPRPAPGDRLAAAEAGPADEAARAVGRLRDLAAALDEGAKVTPEALAAVAPYL